MCSALTGLGKGCGRSITLLSIKFTKGCEQTDPFTEQELAEGAAEFDLWFGTSAAAGIGGQDRTELMGNCQKNYRAGGGAGG